MSGVAYKPSTFGLATAIEELPCAKDPIEKKISNNSNSDFFIFI
jgi:hypothetical protein